MTISRMGSWRNPPLAYVVAEVKFSPYLTLGQHAPDFQAGIRKQFPRTREAFVARFELGSHTTPDPERAWRFFTEDQRLGIDLSKRNLSLHATEYEHFESFLQPLRLMLSVAEKTIPDLFVEQLGLRYIDYVLPVEGESAFDYVSESLRGVRPPGASEPDECYWIGHFRFERGGVNLRVIPRLPAGAFMPPAFGALELASAKPQVEAQERALRHEVVGCIDTDRILPVEKKLETDEVLEAFKLMHADVSAVFRSALSEKAKKAWM